MVRCRLPVLDYPWFDWFHVRLHPFLLLTCDTFWSGHWNSCRQFGLVFCIPGLMKVVGLQGAFYICSQHTRDHKRVAPLSRNYP